MAQVKRHVADLWVDKLLGQYPNFADKVAQYRSQRAVTNNFQNTWPDWCGVPTTAIHGILESVAGQPSIHSKKQLDYQLEIAPKLASAVLWNQSKNIYTFDPTVFDQLYHQPMTDRIPVDCFMALPFYCVFIEAPVTVVGKRAKGFFVHLDNDVHRNIPEISLLYLLETDETFPLSVPLIEGTIDDSLTSLMDFMAEDMKKVKCSVPNIQIKLGQNFPSMEEITGALNLVLYLCSAQADVPNVTGVRRSTHKVTGYVRRAAVWDVGVCIGKTIRGYLAQPKTKVVSISGETEADADSDQQTTKEISGKRPHVRRAHWHSFYTGPKDGERKVVVKWLPPIPVKITEEAKKAQTPAVVHKVI